MNNAILISKDTLEHMYIEKEMPMHKISKEIGVSIGAVHKYMKKYNIPARDKKETFTMRGHKLTQEQCLLISSRHKNKVLSEETKLKISKSKVGKFRNATKFGGHKKQRADGYIIVYNPNHKQSSADGYIMEHRLIMEFAIGRELKKYEVVHHKNEIRYDNRIENLQLMTLKQHISYHLKIRHGKRRNAL